MLRTVMFVNNWGSYRARDVAELAASLAEALVSAGVAVASTGSASGDGEDDADFDDAQPAEVAVGEDVPSSISSQGEEGRKRSRQRSGSR